MAVRVKVPLGNRAAEDAVRLVATGAATTVTVVVAVLVGSSTEVAVIVTVCTVVGAVQVLPIQVPAVLLQVTVPRLPPVTALLKTVFVETVSIRAAGLIAPTATVCGATVTKVVAVVPAAFVTVRL
jgi:hypothetical protein